jgi:hypothetical protein
MADGVPLCTAQKCDELSRAIAAACQQNGWGPNNLVLICDPITGACCNCKCTCVALCTGMAAKIKTICQQNGWPPGHMVLVCAEGSGGCCNCMCLVYGASVAVPGGTKAIETFAPGDSVLAAGPSLDWVPLPVEFSDGTAATAVQPQMIYFTYGDPAQTLIVPPDHTFLTPGGKLIRADRLQVGGSLVAADGGEVEITRIEIKEYHGGVWNIATRHEKPTNLDGHLINTQGVVSGDYAVQLLFDELTEAGYTTEARRKT